MNLELFEKVKAAMRNNPENVSMLCFAERRYCGTVACVAGWTLIESGINPLEMPGQDISNKAAELLGIETIGIFYPSYWPHELADRMLHAECGNVEVVCEAIDAFIADPGQFKSMLKGEDFEPGAV